MKCVLEALWALGRKEDDQEEEDDKNRKKKRKKKSKEVLVDKDMVETIIDELFERMGTDGPEIDKNGRPVELTLCTSSRRRLHLSGRVYPSKKTAHAHQPKDERPEIKKDDLKAGEGDEGGPTDTELYLMDKLESDSIPKGGSDGTMTRPRGPRSRSDETGLTPGPIQPGLRSISADWTTPTEKQSTDSYQTVVTSSSVPAPENRPRKKKRKRLDCYSGEIRITRSRTRYLTYSNGAKVILKMGRQRFFYNRRPEFFLEIPEPPGKTSKQELNTESNPESTISPSVSSTSIDWKQLLPDGYNPLTWLYRNYSKTKEFVKGFSVRQ